MVVKPVLAENADVLRSLGIAQELAQARLRVSPRIAVRDAGAVRGVRSVAFSDFRQRIQRILVRGAGFARSIVLQEMPTPTPSPTPTDTPIPLPTPIPTAIPPTATPTPDVFPAVRLVRPNQGSNHTPNDIHIFGERFVEGSGVSLGTIPLTQTTYVDAGLLQAVVPAGFTAGIHDLTVTNPDGGSATLPNAYTAFDNELNDDLFAHDYELWSEPAAPHAGAETTLHLLVRRQGGKQPLADVTVRFFLGDPAAGGVLIGNGVIPLLSPRSAGATTGVAWTPPAAGEYAIHALIDADNAIAETYEHNNQVRRTIVVLPPAADQLAPRVDNFTINGGARRTAERVVTLDTVAADPEPGTGVARLLFVEYEFSQAGNEWTPVQQSPWLDYEAASTSHPWNLLPVSGLKYLQVWAADGAGNISLFPGKTYINFLPPLQRVATNQRKVYRFQLEAGQTLSARLEPVSGDPDLYIWPPDHETRAPWVSNLPDGVDDLVIQAPLAGRYQVEVYGYSAAEFRLIVDIGDGLLAASVEGGIDPNKEQFTQPPMDHADEPGAAFALTTPGQAQQAIFLPIVQN
jgi:hypothetical protein